MKTKTVASRFADRAVLKACLMSNNSISHSSELVDSIIDAGELREYKSGTDIIVQGDKRNDLFFILSGEVDIYVNGRNLYPRQKREHVGEMSFISPDEDRSATVKANGDVEVLFVPFGKMQKIANDDKGDIQLWRNLAKVVCARLKGRNGLVRPSNEKPVLFIGSSAEKLSFANDIKFALRYSKVDVYLWSDSDIFHASSNPLQRLQEMAQFADFAVLLWTPDDVVRSKHKQSSAARDNVIFELGLFIGQIGHERSFIVKPRVKNVNLPSDLEGCTPIKYNDENERMSSEMATVAHEIMQNINRLGPR